MRQPVCVCFWGGITRTQMLTLPCSRLSSFGFDIIVATASTCTAYANLNGGTLSCNTAVSFVVSNSRYFYLGPASALGMEPTNSC